MMSSDDLKLCMFIFILCAAAICCAVMDNGIGAFGICAIAYWMVTKLENDDE